MGRQGKTHVPKPAQRAAVEESVGLGGSQRVIAKCLGISRTTLEKAYRHELDVGAEIACEKVAKTLFERATDPKSGMAGVVAAIFFLKARGAGNWKEIQSIEHTGRDGDPLAGTTNTTTIYREVPRFMIPDNGRDSALLERLGVKVADMERDDSGRLVPIAPAPRQIAAPRPAKVAA